MLTWGDDVEVHALRERGWSVAAIARHLGRDPSSTWVIEWAIALTSASRSP